MGGEKGKAALRARLLAARPARPADDLERCRALLAVPEIAAARVVAGYAALPGEPDIGEALEVLRDRGVRVLLPEVLADRDLEFRVDSGERVTGRLGIRVPPPDAPAASLGEADVVVVPALAADRFGHRLGRGGGSYDRALARRRAGAFVIAVVHEEEVLATVPVEPHDVAVDAVLAGAQLLRAQP